jgi:hypothetical protein
MRGRYWMGVEIDQVQALHHAGHTDAAIARILRCTVGSVESCRHVHKINRQAPHELAAPISTPNRARRGRQARPRARAAGRNTSQRAGSSNAVDADRAVVAAGRDPGERAGANGEGT